MRRSMKPIGYLDKNHRSLGRSNRREPFATILLLFLVALYVLIPDPFIRISHAVFVPIYLYGRNISVEIPRNSEDGNAIRLAIIARPPQVPYDHLIVAVPPSIAFDIGTIVSNNDGIPVGRLDRQLTDNNATVILFSSSVAEESYSINDYVTVGSGIGGGGLEFSIPIEISVAVGDAVIHQKTGVVVAYVVGVKEEESGIVQKVFAPLSVNFFRITAVYVEKTKESVVVEEKEEEDVEKKPAKRATDDTQAFSV